MDIDNNNKKERLNYFAFVKNLGFQNEIQQRLERGGVLFYSFTLNSHFTAHTTRNQFCVVIFFTDITQSTQLQNV